MKEKSIIYKIEELNGFKNTINIYIPSRVVLILAPVNKSENQEDWLNFIVKWNVY